MRLAVGPGFRVPLLYDGMVGNQVKLNQKRPENLARLTAAVVNLTDLQSAHAQFVKQKDTVTVLRLLSAHPRLVEVSAREIVSSSRPPVLFTYLL